MWFVWRLFKMNRVMVGAVDEFFERFLTSTLAYLGLKTTPRGGFVLEKFFIKEEGWPKNAYLKRWFSKKCKKISSENKITAGALGKFFLPWSLKNLWKNVLRICLYTCLYGQKRPFPAKLSRQIMYMICLRTGRKGREKEKEKRKKEKKEKKKEKKEKGGKEKSG